MKIAADRTSPKGHDFRLFLQDELVRRCRQNPKYSLRAFAKFLGVAPSFLSHLLRGRRSVTQKTISSFSEKLRLGPQVIEDFQRALLESSEPSTSRTSDSIRLHQLTLDQFAMISDWYHYAILELLLIDSFEPSREWVARVLGITVSEVNAAIERLQRLEMLEITSDGRWINRGGNHTTVGNDFTTAAFRNLQKGILGKAIAALDALPMEVRDQSSLTMAVDSSLLPEIKACIKDFRRQIASFQERSNRRDQVYHLSVSYYPVLDASHPRSKIPQTRSHENEKRS